MLYNIKVFFKKFWGWIIAFFAAIFGALFFVNNKRKDAEAKALKDIIDSHNKEINEIKETVAEEHVKLAENEKQYKETMETIQDQYEEASQDLSNKKKEQISQLVRDYGKNPNELAKKLSDVTGFKIILPED